MSCTGCLLSEQEKQQLLQSAEKEAKKYAVDNKKLMVIYFLSDGRPAYMEASAAKQAGIIPVKYISHLL